MKVEIVDSGEQDSLFSKNTAIKPEGDITKAISVEIPQKEMDLVLQGVSDNLSREFAKTSDEAFKESFLPATEDDVEEVKASREAENEIPDDATSVEVEDTPLEAVEDVADRIFLYCDIVDMKEPP